MLPIIVRKCMDRSNTTHFFCEHTTAYRHPHQTMHHKARYNTSLQWLMFSTRGSKSRFGCLSRTPKKTTIHLNSFVGTFLYKQTCLSNLCCIVLFQTNHGTLQAVKSDSSWYFTEAKLAIKKIVQISPAVACCRKSHGTNSQRQTEASYLPTKTLTTIPNTDDSELLRITGVW